MLYKNETEVKIGDMCMLENGKVVECNNQLFQKGKHEMTKIVDRTLIKLS